jgi:hypothetical protein
MAMLMHSDFLAGHRGFEKVPQSKARMRLSLQNFGEPRKASPARLLLKSIDMKVMDWGFKPFRGA